MKTLYFKNPEFNPATITVAAELRNLIQTWRKENKLPIDFRVPTLNIWYKDEIITAAIREGRTEAQNMTHLCELCQIDRLVRYDDQDIIFKMNNLKFDFAKLQDYDVIIWSDLGGTMKYGNILDDSQNLVKTASEKRYYERY